MSSAGKEGGRCWSRFLCSSGYLSASFQIVETHLANFLGTFAMVELSTHSQGKTDFTFRDFK